ncbi:HAMP domain-containing sensor histidine kinase [Parasphingorhabdus cellanae]|uniref:histidine kinase n=1 Tax=Parasphingorhabdus cellanae TaxID=2806553 RepID=A0ABX7T7S2_9SPHN|nr:ATP-binding protein [Parasphingorhabdus cellanae]QTD56504.1 two-component sensor histidine kinase [Parasphingorhabdus cellanae]
MTRLLPKSLIGQLLMLVAVTLLIAQGINTVLLYRGVQNQKIIESSVSAVGRITGEIERINERGFREPRPRRDGSRRGRRNRPSVTAETMIGSTQQRLPVLEGRAALAFENMGVNVLAVEVARVDELPSNMINNVIGRGRGRQQTLRAVGYRNLPNVIDGYIIMSAQIADGQWLNIASAIRDRNPRLMRTLLFQTAVIYLILLIPLIWLGRHISRPLQALTKAAQDFKPGVSEPVVESGPPDTRQLMAAFNAMNGRVGSMLDEKDVMLGAIGHDLRTPLAALRVRVESVEDDNERERMIAGIDDMDRTLDDILSLARLGRSDERTEPTDISALIETVADEYTDMGEEVSFTRSGRITANIRATLIRRALRNLIGNAVKYGKQAAITVDKSGDKLVIHVDDEGPGIPVEQIDAMFEPFARAEISRNRATGGSGLGLTLARAIVRDHGGDVILENRKEGGLRASLMLNLD